MLDTKLVQSLLKNPSPVVRSKVAASVSDELSKGELNDVERQIAVEIVEHLACDVEQQVRQALSDHIKSCPFLPSEVARELADDVDSVALPIIRFSTVLSDVDLISIVRRGNQKKHMAVAQRQTVPSAVAYALADTKNKRVVGSLLENHGSEISENGFHKVLVSFEDDEEIQGLMVERPTMPFSVTSRLISHVSEELRERMIDRHDFPREFADELAIIGRDKVLANTIGMDRHSADAESLAANLHQRNLLTPMLMLRTLCYGDLRFFVASMAELTNIPFDNAMELVHDDGPLGLESIYAAARLPPPLFAAFRDVLEIVKDVERDPSMTWGLDCTRRVVEGLSADIGESPSKELEQVLSRLQRRIATPRP